MENWVFDNVPKIDEIQQLKMRLNGLNSEQREILRNSISSEIINDRSEKIIILSGPGTGKSHIFVSKIKSILEKNPQAKILVTTFVNKLAKELCDKIENDRDLFLKKGQIASRTLHAIASELLKISKKYAGHNKIINFEVAEEIWFDVLKICQADAKKYSYDKFQHQAHDLNYESNCLEDSMWKKIYESYNKMICLYKALSFDDQIKLAYEEICSGNLECPKYDFIIVDEYQDFNKCEKELIKKMIENSSCCLFAGDDDQVLYDKLKNSHKEYIRELYHDANFKKAFLPFCGRCSSNIVNAARAFIEEIRKKEPNSIDKIYLPISEINDTPKISVIACPNPNSAVSYIEKFIEKNSDEIKEIENKLKIGEDSDPFLFVISPNCKEKHIKNYKKLKKIIEEWQHITPSLISNTYMTLCEYLSLAKDPKNNLSLRKIMSYEEVNEPHLIIEKALDNKIDIANIANKDIIRINTNAKKILEICEKYKFDDINSLVNELCALDFIEKILKNYEESKNTLEKEIADFKFKVTSGQVERLNAIELMSFPRCKGLSAQHVIIIGFDDSNMKLITENAFYVAITRARKSLHLITSLKIAGAKSSHSYLDKLSLKELEFLKHTKNLGTISLGSRQKFDSTIKTWLRFAKKR